MKPSVPYPIRIRTGYSQKDVTLIWKLFMKFLSFFANFLYGGELSLSVDGAQSGRKEVSRMTKPRGGAPQEADTSRLQ